MTKKITSLAVLLSLVLTLCVQVVPVAEAAAPVSLSLKKVTIKKGETVKIYVKRAKGVKVKKTTYSSKNTSVATVSKSGIISAKSGGKTTVVAKVKYKKGKKTKTKSLKCAVTVKASSYEGPGKVLNIWSWDASLQDRIERYYPDYKKGYIGDVKVRFIIDSENDKINYQKKLDEAIENQIGGDAENADIVDLFAAETDFEGKYADASLDYAIPFSELGIPKQDLKDILPVCFLPSTDKNGEVRGINLEGNACGLIYRKSIAKEALGTDDPVEVQNMLSSWDKMKEVGEKLKEKGYYLYGTPDDMQRVFVSNDTTPFGENGKISVTPGMEEWYTFAKDCCDAGYIKYPAATMWSDEYMSGFNKKGKVMCFTFTNWMNGWPMPGNADKTKGDWQIIQGPKAFCWGGTYLFAARGTDNDELVEDVIRKLAIDEDNLESWAKDGNFTPNREVNKWYSGSPAESGFFANEDFFGTLNNLADAYTTVGGKSEYDSACIECAWDPFAKYFNGKMSLESAINKWQNEVIKIHKDLVK